MSFIKKHPFIFGLISLAVISLIVTPIVILNLPSNNGEDKGDDKGDDEPKEKGYTVTWINEDGTVLEVDEDVKKGTFPTYDGKDPEKNNDEQYTYSWSGWDKELLPVVDNVVYKATFSKELNYYTITWINHDVTLKSQCAYNTIPSYPGEINTYKDNVYTYYFSHWSPEVTPVKGDKTYTAIYEKEIITYEVMWMVDNDVIYVGYYHYGDTPIYQGDTPFKEQDEEYSYEFIGWDRQFEPVHENTIYHALFKKTYNEYEITWYIDEAHVTKENYHYGDSIIYKGDKPVKEQDEYYTYEFDNFYNDDGYSSWDYIVTSDCVFYAEFFEIERIYTITFIVDDDEYELNYLYGDYPSFPYEIYKEPTAEYTYNFSHWEPEIESVTEDATYEAIFTTETNIYMVTWCSANDFEIYSEEYYYGDTPIYDESTYGLPVDPNAPSGYDSIFDGWDKEISPVTGNITYYATYKYEKTKCKVYWHIDEDNCIEEDCLWGDAVDVPTPEKEASIDKTYTFDYWLTANQIRIYDDTVEIYSDTHFYAYFIENPRKYAVKFMNDGEILQSGEWEYGTTPTYNGDDPTREHTDPNKIYLYSGWSPSISAVEGDITYQASYIEYNRSDLGDFLCYYSNKIDGWVAEVINLEATELHVPSSFEGHTIISLIIDSNSAVEELYLPSSIKYSTSLPSSLNNLHFDGSEKQYANIYTGDSFLPEHGETNVYLNTGLLTEIKCGYTIETPWSCCSPFSYCASIIKAENLTICKRALFKGCKNLLTASLKEEALNDYFCLIEDEFMDCTSLETITFPEKTEGVMSHFADGCISLKSISNLSNITYFDNYCFYNCYSLVFPNDTLNFNKDLRLIDSTTFFGVKVKHLVLDGDNKDFAIYDDMLISTDPANIIIVPTMKETLTLNGTFDSLRFIYAPSVKTLTIDEGVKRFDTSCCAFENLKTLYFNAPDCDLVQYQGINPYWCSIEQMDDLYIGDNVTSMSINAFDDLRVTNVHIGDGLETIPSRAFGNSTVVSVYLGENVQKISGGSFDCCTSLENVYFSNKESLNYIGGDAFYSCSKLSNFDFDACVNVTYYGYSSFSRSNINSVTISTKTTYIGDWAFSYCSNLAYFAYQGTTGEWDLIEKGKKIMFSSKIENVVCSDGIVVPS